MSELFNDIDVQLAELDRVVAAANEQAESFHLAPAGESVDPVERVLRESPVPRM